jgi:hypothetical protein
MYPALFDFAINLVTAKALGLTVPPMLLARAETKWSNRLRFAALHMSLIGTSRQIPKPRIYGRY